MDETTIVLVGGPDTGKTNFLARLWESLRSRTGRLVCPTPPDDIKYVEDALGHLLEGTFAPRSTKNIEESRAEVTIPVRIDDSKDGAATRLLVPDVTGELWKSAVETREISVEWMRDLKRASGAVLFVRVLSEQNRSPLDWVATRALLSGQFTLLKDQEGLPTQVELCELLHFLELTLRPRDDGSRPRVAICLTAYDLLDAEAAALGPSAYLRKEYPLFYGKLRDTLKIDVRTFGISVVGGDLDVDPDFREEFLRGDLSRSGYVVIDGTTRVQRLPDISHPVAWLVQGG